MVKEDKEGRVSPYCVRGMVIQELGAGIESPVISIELDRERRRAILVLL